MSSRAASIAVGQSPRRAACFARANVAYQRGVPSPRSHGTGRARSHSARFTSGTTTIQGTAGRPIVDGEFISRNSGVGDEFFSASLRISRSFRLGGTTRLEAMAEVFNLTNTVNEIARNTTFGTGAYPANPAPTFGQVTAVGDPRSWQFAMRLHF